MMMDLLTNWSFAIFAIVFGSVAIYELYREWLDELKESRPPEKL
jgi:hypothetical protein